MTAITLKKLPDDIHRTIKRIQLDYEDEGVKKTIEEIYIDFLRRGIKDFQTEKPAK